MIQLVQNSLEFLKTLIFTKYAQSIIQLPISFVLRVSIYHSLVFYRIVVWFDSHLIDDFQNFYLILAICYGLGKLPGQYTWQLHRASQLLLLLPFLFALE